MLILSSKMSHNAKFLIEKIVKIRPQNDKLILEIKNHYHPTQYPLNTPDCFNRYFLKKVNLNSFPSEM